MNLRKMRRVFRTREDDHRRSIKAAPAAPSLNGKRMLCLVAVMGFALMLIMSVMAFATGNVAAASETAQASNEMMLMFIGLIPMIFIINLMTDMISNRRRR